MSNAARLRDQSVAPADTHGCSDCSHEVKGPVTAGSSNVLVNSRPAVRVGDRGIHAKCCGTNRWTARAGAPRVLINGKSAHRRGDATLHCGGIGATITGSSDVLIGDFVGSARPRVSRFEDVAFCVIDGAKQPVSNLHAIVVGPDGQRIPVVTGPDGRVILRHVPRGRYILELSQGAVVGDLSPIDGKEKKS